MMFVAGLDLGGSHVDCVVADGNGLLLGRGRGGPANLLSAGPETTMASLREALTEATAALPGGVADIARCVIGAAGGADSRVAAELSGMAAAAGIAGAIHVTHDAEIALAGALLHRPGIFFIAGTGSIAYGEDEAGNRARAGGWGPLLGDEGSGYYLGLAGLRAVMRAFDGRGAPTVMTGLFLKELGLGREEELATLAHSPGTLTTTTVAALAPLVIAAAREGDPTAVDILAAAAAELVLAAKAVAVRLGMEAPCITYGGGLFKAGETWSTPLRTALKREIPSGRLTPPAAPPVAGALFLALGPPGRLRPEIAAGIARQLGEDARWASEW
ncbi:MAG: hypothetical protein GX493_09935 [Firmicutes bacterium]|nr:hypothetical protein [Bacillota bacterium]